MRFGALPCLLLVAAFAALGGGPGCSAEMTMCRPGTLLVTIQFLPSAADADEIAIDVSVDNGPSTTPARRARSGPGPTETVEIRFPKGYPDDKPVRVHVVAFRNTVAIGEMTGSFNRLPAGCGTMTLEVWDSSTSGAAGTGGGSAGRGGAGGSSGGSTAGRGGSAAGSAGGGTGGSTGGGLAGRGGTGGSTGGGTGGSTGGGLAGRGGTGGSVAGRGGTGGGGTGGTAGPPACRFASFDTTAEGFVLHPYDTRAGNLAIREAGARATMDWTGSEGAPSPPAGALKVDAPFDDYEQFITVVRLFSTLQNWTGVTKLHVRLRIASGLDHSKSSLPGIQVYAQSYNVGTTDGPAERYHFRGNWVTGSTGSPWLDYSVGLAPDGDFDPSKIEQIGIGIGVGDGKVRGLDNPLKPTAAVIYVDSFWLEGACTGTAGMFPAPVSCGANWAVANDGYVTVPAAAGACWRGYAYNNYDNDSTVVPKSFWTCGAGCLLRLTGTVGSATEANNYAGFASISFAVGQEWGTAVFASYTPTGTGLTVTFSNTSGAGTGPPRIELRDQKTGGFWCSTVTGGSPATVPYATFNTACWNPVTGTAYAKQPFTDVTLSLPGGPANSTLNLSLDGVREY